MINLRRWRRRIYRKVVRLQASPHAIAWGASLGVLFGCLMPPGLQLVTGVPVTVLLGGNVLVMVAFTFVSNPFTYVPLYFFTCKVGEWFLQALGADVSLGENFRRMLGSAMGLEFGLMLDRLKPVAWCWVTGGLLVGFAGAVPAYYFTRLAVRAVHKRRAFAHRRRIERLRSRAASLPPLDEEAPDEQPPPPFR